jgi:purine-binding chemotaxis protein CheW
MRGQHLVAFVADRKFALPLGLVCDLVKPLPLTRVPHAPDGVVGIFNLRGRIVTALDLRERLGLPGREAGAAAIDIVVDHRGELYALIVDDVDESTSPDEASRADLAVLDIAALIAGLA